MNKPQLIMLLLVLVVSCNKKEKPPDKIDAIQASEIKSDSESLLKNNILLLLDIELSREDFKNNVIPLVDQLKRSNEKYKMISIISYKILRESNKEAYKLGIENLKQEILKN